MIRILIDPVACDAYGYCAELLPEAITLDEWGYPIVDGKPLPPQLADAGAPGRPRLPAPGHRAPRAQGRALSRAGSQWRAWSSKPNPLTSRPAW